MLLWFPSVTLFVITFPRNQILCLPIFVLSCVNNSFNLRLLGAHEERDRFGTVAVPNLFQLGLHILTFFLPLALYQLLSMDELLPLCDHCCSKSCIKEQLCYIPQALHSYSLMGYPGLGFMMLRYLASQVSEFTTPTLV